jgi:short-subunit dehydrogenase
MDPASHLSSTAPNPSVVITGASSGIGAALARLLAGPGRALALIARRADRLSQVAAACHDAGASVVECVGDVTRRSDVEALRTAALERHTRIDVWINNAERGIARRVEELTDADLDSMIAINLKSALYGIQAVLPHFKSRGSGLVVNVGSILGRVPLALRGGYCAGKHALLAVAACLRQELTAEGLPAIRIMTVMPGPVATEFASALEGERPHGNPLDEARRRFASDPQIAPWLRLQTADEVARSISEALDDPRPEVFTAAALREHALRYVEDPARREAQMAPSSRSFSARSSSAGSGECDGRPAGGVPLLQISREPDWQYPTPEPPVAIELKKPARSRTKPGSRGARAHPH